MGLCCPETIFGGFLNEKVTLLMEAWRERALTDLNSYVTALLDVLAFSSSCELELPVIATSPFVSEFKLVTFTIHILFQD